MDSSFASFICTFNAVYAMNSARCWKSGAGIVFINSSIEMIGFSSIRKQPSITSLRLCGGILVAILTAIPADPLINRLGNLVGNLEPE